MFSKNLILSLSIFTALMVLISILKTQTRILEKNIFSYKKKISKLENNLYEAQIDYSYLSSPSSISKKIQKYTDDDYQSINYSEIYFSIDQFLKVQNRITKHINEKRY